MRLTFVVFLIVILSDGCRHSRVKPSADNTVPLSNRDSSSVKWIFNGINGSTLKFKAGKQFNTNLYELKYLGQVENGHKAPFLIFSGRGCDECDENISIYIHSPSDGNLNVQDGKNRCEYPGTEKDYESDSLVYKARAFFGEVLPGIKGVVWYQQQLMEDNSLQNSVYLVNLNKGITKDPVIRYTDGVKLTLQLLKKGHCQEIKGLDYKSEP